MLSVMLIETVKALLLPILSHIEFLMRAYTSVYRSEPVVNSRSVQYVLLGGKSSIGLTSEITNMYLID